jgi:hypothetical protein
MASKCDEEKNSFTNQVVKDNIVFPLFLSNLMVLIFKRSIFYLFFSRLKILGYKKVDLWNLKTFIFHFSSKMLSKSPCVRVSHFFVFSIFVQKVTFKIPIGTILNFFCKKSQFLHTLEIIDFAWDNHVIYRKKFTFFFVFNSFSP